ncbi:MAG: nuclear transport factor 2 family protein [Acidobacteriaceae bacterium]
MDSIDPIGFAREWEAAWNRRDVEAVLEHFHEDAVFTSPLAQKIGVAADGVLKGKSAIRSYWETALAKSQASETRFQVTRVYQGVDTLVIAFVIASKDQKVDRVEVLRFKDGLVIEGHGTVLVD